MKKDNLYRAICATFILVALAGCNDYNFAAIEYDEDAQNRPQTSANAPDIDPSWDLELITNVGQQGANVFVYKDQKYNKLFTRTRGWNGGDGVLTTKLPDGNIFWSFNDSFYGSVKPEDRSRYNSNFPRNSIMIQKAMNGVPGETDADLVWLADYVSTDPASDKYFQARTHIRHPWGEKSEEEIEQGLIDNTYVYWAGDATVYNGKLQVIWGAVDVRDGALRRFGSCLATYDLDGTMPAAYYLPGLPDYLPQPGDYMYLDRKNNVNHNYNDDTMGYGNTLWEDEDGHTYLYGTNGYDVLVARTETHDLNSKWEYYVRNVAGQFEWVEHYPSDEEKLRSQIMATGYQCNMPWVFKDGDTYYMVAQEPYFGIAMRIYRSSTPWGPFTDEKTLFSLPKTLDKLGSPFYNWLYMINLHQGLSREGELVFSTNTDAKDFSDNFGSPGSADFYRPFFFRVFNWKSVYEEE